VSALTGQDIIMTLFASKTVTVNMCSSKAKQAGMKYFGLFPGVPASMARPPMMPATASKKEAEIKQVAL
jgi:hypothetical protein